MCGPWYQEMSVIHPGSSLNFDGAHLQQDEEEEIQQEDRKQQQAVIMLVCSCLDFCTIFL